MKIGAILPQTLLDFPGKVSAIFFTLGCNFRCPFCYNKEAVFGSKDVDMKEIDQFLDERTEFLDAIVISGGEPTIHKDLPEFIEKIRSKGYLVGLETNGSNPEVVENLLNKNYLDFIGMDVKTSLNKYNEATGIDIDTKKIKRTIDLIKNSGINYEFRITAVPKLVDKTILKEISKLLKGAEKAVIQQFENDKELINPEFEKIVPYTEKQLNELKNELLKNVKKVEIRSS